MVYGAALIPDKPIYRVREDGEEYYIQVLSRSDPKDSAPILYAEE
jgi:hypothetical protein